MSEPTTETTQPNEGEQQTGTVTEPTAIPPVTADDVAKWKELARKHEARAKENADAAKKLQELEDAQKSEAQRLTDQLTAAQNERDQAAAEALRMRVAVKRGVKHDDLDLLGSGSEEEIDARAQRLVGYYPKTLGTPTPGKPVEQLHPGAAPKEEMSPEEETWQKLFGSATTGK